MKKNICFYILSLFIPQLLSAQATLVDPIYMYSYLDHLNGKLFFFASTPASPNDYEPWTSDGTLAGTHQIKDINPGSGAGVADGSQWAAEYNGNTPVIFNNKVYFLGDDGVHGLEVWRSDGTDTGTVMLKDIYPGPQGFTDPYLRFPYFCELNGTLYFSANDGTHGFELWKTDGTTAGTVMVKDISTSTTDGSLPTNLVKFNNAIYFSAFDDVAGVEVFKTDGTANGTQVLKDVIPGLQGATNDGYWESLPTHFTVSGNYLYYIARIDSTLPVETYLYRTDGTAAGTIALDNSLEGVAELTDLNGTLYFFSNDGVTINSNLYKSDGTPGGTVYVPTNNTIRTTGNMFTNGSTMYFSGDQSNFTSFGLFKSDGSTAGTSQVYSLVGLSSYPEVRRFISAGSSVFCVALTAVGPNAMDTRILQSDGTNSHLYSGAAAFNASTMLNGNFYFSGRDTINGDWGLYKIVPVLSVGVDEKLNDDAISLYPNPNSGSFTLQLHEMKGESLKVTVVNTYGQSVFQNIYNDFRNDVLQIDLPHCTPGVYVMMVECDGKIVEKKIVVED